MDFTEKITANEILKQITFLLLSLVSIARYGDIPGNRTTFASFCQDSLNSMKIIQRKPMV